MSDVPVVGLFDGVLARGSVAAIVADRAWLAALLEVESGLARAEAALGIVPAEAAETIDLACRPDAFDVATLGSAAAASGNPVVPLVAALRSAVGPSSARWVHHGATSQDILDTAAMLVARRATDAILADLGSASDAAARLADAHRATLMAARTLLQQALPTTFAAKAAGWLAGLDAAIVALAAARARLAVQLGGAAGTLAGLGDAGPAVVARLAAELGLVEPLAPWHAERSRIAELAGALGTASAAIAKPALDLVLLAQTEVAEALDATPDRGGSSTLPQKRNPVAAVAARACAAQAPGLVATLLVAAGGGEHERAAGAWHAEWRPLAELLRSTGSAAAWLRDALEHLEVDADRMRDGLATTRGLLLAERVVGALTPALGREAADAEVAAACADVLATGRDLASALGDRPRVREALEPAAIEALLDPAGYLGSAGAFVDRILAAHRALVRAGAPR